jgi:penicillin-binding protein 2
VVVPVAPLGLPKRLAIMALVCLVGGIALLGRLAYLQLAHGADYAAEAWANATMEIREPAPRGRILDRDGVILAEWTVARRRLRLEPQPSRHYPLGAAASHVLGYLGEVDATDIALYPGLYLLGETRGWTGVEAAGDWRLRGRPASTVYEVTAEGKITRILRVKPAQAGQDLRLTLDARLQVLAFDRLGRAMRKARQDSGGRAAAPGGAVVVLDPRNGAILALVSRPSFDPEAISAGAGPAAIDPITDPKTPLLNRAVAGLYPPGSTFKIITAAAALEESVTTPGEKLTDRGRYRLAGKRCWKTGGHGVVSLREALAWSCNLYFYEMGERLGPDRLAAWARRFGLGEPTRPDLCEPYGSFGPGRSGPEAANPEPAGILGDASWKADRFPSDPSFWPAEVADLAIGQGFHAYTPLQMAVVMAAIANGGNRWRPYVIEAALDNLGTVVARSRPETSGRVALADATLQAVREGLRAAVMDPNVAGKDPGTAASSFGPAFRRRWGLDVAGKTGTAEHGAGSGRADDAWFLAYAPYDQPQIVVAVLIEEGGSGSRIAAPVARDIIEAWLAETTLTPGPGAPP